MNTLTYTDTLTVIECGSCHISFAVPGDFDRDRRRDKKLFSCPSGCRISYLGEREEDRLWRLVMDRDEALARERQSTEYARQRAQTAIRSRNAMKGQVTKVKNRVAKGICPCCNRSFPQLAAHMESEHPDFAEATP